MHSEDAHAATEMLVTVPTDEDDDLPYRAYSLSSKRDGGGPEWGYGTVRRGPFPWWLY